MTVLGGAIFGGIAGSLFHKGLGMSKDDLARIDGDLNGGKAAVAILANADEAAAVSAKLAELGGKPESHAVSEEVVQEAQTVAAEAPAEVAEAPAEAPVAAPVEEEGATPASA
jgi:hypothetical protein